MSAKENQTQGLLGSIAEANTERQSPVEAQSQAEIDAETDAFLAAIYARRGGWQPIETAPKDGTRVLLFVGEPVIGYFETAKEWPSSSRGFNAWTTGPLTYAGADGGYDRIGEPTHWMPLPAPPEQP